MTLTGGSRLERHVSGRERRGSADRACDRPHAAGVGQSLHRRDAFHFVVTPNWERSRSRGSASCMAPSGSWTRPEQRAFIPGAFVRCQVGRLTGAEEPA
jgi:hypothetical protein